MSVVYDIKTYLEDTNGKREMETIRDLTCAQAEAVKSLLERVQIPYRVRVFQAEQKEGEYASLPLAVASSGECARSAD